LRNLFRAYATINLYGCIVNEYENSEAAVERVVSMFTGTTRGEVSDYVQEVDFVTGCYVGSIKREHFAIL